MVCPKCSLEQADQNIECSRCGIVFKKYHVCQNTLHKINVMPEKENDTAAKISFSIKDIFFYVEPGVSPFIFAGRAAFLLVVFIWSWKFILAPMESNYTGASFLHLVNLPFHEAGHIVFRPFGEIITSLGGTLGQLLIPLICLFVFLLKQRNTFGASISLWWFGENFMDIAPYINDARDMEMPLLGGNTGQTSPYGFHDWEFILTELGWLRYDHTLANISYRLGTILMLISFIWGGYILYRQFKNL
ncbi:MAG: zinc ribbon domain-containing protein [Pseudomonadota bacterium]